MTNIISYWYLYLAFFAVGFVCAYYIYNFTKLTKEEQFTCIKQWLIYACLMAEKEFGSGTGKLKLASVYDKFVSKFPALALIISVDTFSEYVDEALVTMREMLQTNQNINNIIVEKTEE